MKPGTFFLRHAIKEAYKIPFFVVARLSPRFIDSIPIHPIRAGISVTHNCNSRCITCNFWKSESQNELTLTEMVDILRQVRSLGITDLNLTGGEPLLRSDLPDIILAASNLKFDRISVTTNGLLLTQEKIEQLVKNGLTSIYISLNGNEKVHDTTRGINGAYTRTLESIRALVELRNSKFPNLQISMQTVVMGITIDQILDMVNVCRQFDIGFSLSPLNTSRPWQSDTDPALKVIHQEQFCSIIKDLHHMKKNYPRLIRDYHTSLEYIKHYFIDNITNDIPCYLGFLTIAIKPNGDVFPGGCLSLLPAGNLRKLSLKQIISSATYRDGIRRMFLKQCPGCACDHILNLYAHFPAGIEEIKWRLKQLF